jgi:hypothetical protein
MTTMTTTTTTTTTIMAKILSVRFAKADESYRVSRPPNG